MKINVGCGPLKYPDEIGIDLYQTPGADIVADSFNLPFDDNSIEFVRLDHILEHQPVRKCASLLTEAYRVLQSDGIVRVGIPDLEATCREYVKTTNKADKYLLLRTLYGSQVHDGEVHKSGWDSDTLQDLMHSVGFRDIKIEVDPTRTEGECIVGVGIK